MDYQPSGSSLVDLMLIGQIKWIRSTFTNGCQTMIFESDIKDPSHKGIIFLHCDI